MANRANRTNIYGLTGQSGTGKTTVCKVWKSHGFGIIDCDKLAHTVMNVGDCLTALVEAFSSEILNEEGTLNRKALGRIVFSDTGALERLNNISHPYIMTALQKRIDELSVTYPVIIVDAPTLFESGADKLCDKIVGVVSDRDMLISRISARDNISHEDGEKRLNSQKSDDFFRSRCDIIIENTGDLESLEKIADTYAKRDMVSP